MSRIWSLLFFFVLNGIGLQCLTPVKFNHFNCSSDEDCQSFIHNSKCYETYCKCPSNKLLSSDGSKCLNPAKEYDAECNDNVQCAAILSQGVCRNNQCKCGTGYHYLKGFCWKSFKLNESCLRDEQCTSDHEYIGFECNRKVCKCRSGYYERFNSGCRRARMDNESCNLNSDCRDQTVCINMKCTKMKISRKNSDPVPKLEIAEEINKTLICLKGMFEMNNKCVLELGMDCVTNENCSHIPNAVCLDDRVCGCQPPTYVASENNRRCLRASRGQVEDISKSFCQEDVQCGVFGGNSVCVNKKCACNKNSYWEVGSKYCWPITPLGGKCTQKIDCYPTKVNAECVENGSQKVCKCKKGYHQKNFICVPDSLKVEDYCEEDKECLFPNSVCNQNSHKCACEEHYYVQNQQCAPGVKSKCVKNEDCRHLNNTECKMGESSPQCLCLDGYISSDNIKYCLKAAHYNEKCLESFQCKHFLGELGECIDNICLCNQTSHYFNEKCYKSKFVGESCLKLPDCFPGNDPNSVICLKGQCACHYEYSLDDNRLCVKKNSAVALGLYPTLLVFLCIIQALTN